MSDLPAVTQHINMVHHVHWDPMWYSSFQEYRIRLYRLMKKLLRILETNPDYGHFMFDGQVSAIEDYLQVAPEDEEAIRRFVREGRLAIGPWYIQPEEFLISGESLVRNLQLGMRRASELGGAMPVSYLCDPVGHISRLPQILSGFGLKYFCASRGIHDGDKIKSSEFIWEAPDGSDVLVQSMPIGYSHRLPLGQEEFERDLMKKAGKIADYNSTGTILFPQGCDHGEPMEEALALAAEHNRRAGWPQIAFTTLEEHMKGVEAHRERLPKFRGELRHSRNMPILSGILTTRMSVKLANAAVQTGLEKWLEPFSAFHSLLGGEYPTPFLSLAWRYQIRNSFHDCIYGAHADHVTPDVMNDYKQATEIIAWKTNEALYGIACRAGDGARNRLVLFNPSAFDRRGEAVDGTLFFREGELPRRLCVRDAAGNVLPCQVNGVARTIRAADESGNTAGERWGGDGYDLGVSVLAGRIPALGYAVCYFTDEEAQAPETDLTASDTCCENSRLRMAINANGTIDVMDKASGQSYAGLHFFEDAGDRGDQYNFSATTPAGVTTSKTLSARVTCEGRGPVKAVYRVEMDLPLPDGLEESGRGRGAGIALNPVTVLITVRAGCPIVEFHTVLENRSRDHKLTVGFPAGIPVETVDSGCQFGINTRPVALPDTRDWHEKPSGFHPHHRFFAIGDGHRGFAFFDRGLTEHRVTPGGDVSVTLLRSIGLLSRDTLPERGFGHAGPDMPTPLAQELGRQEFDYAICMQGGRQGWEPARASAAYEAPVRAMQLSGGLREQCGLPEEMGLMNIAGDGAMLSAVKLAENGDLILRIYNTRDCAVRAELSFFRPVARAACVDLMERPIVDLCPEKGCLAVELTPFKIVTILATLEERDET